MAIFAVLLSLLCFIFFIGLIIFSIYLCVLYVKLYRRGIKALDIYLKLTKNEKNLKIEEMSNVVLPTSET